MNVGNPSGSLGLIALRFDALRPLVRHLVQKVARVVRTGGLRKLLFARSNYRLDRLLDAVGSVEPD